MFLITGPRALQDGSVCEHGVRNHGNESLLQFSHPPGRHAPGRAERGTPRHTLATEHVRCMLLYVTQDRNGRFMDCN